MANSHGVVLQSGESSKPSVGEFGRLFPGLQAEKFGATDSISDMNMKLLGAAMTAEFDAPKDGPDDEESGIPALFTYFGQFVDHDMTFGPEGRFHTTPSVNVGALKNLSTPQLDLDCVYGRGPDDQPYLFAPEHPGSDLRRMLLGNTIGSGSIADAKDLPRNSVDRALIGDKRNDENAIVSQLHGLFLRFHNRLAKNNSSLSFEEIRQKVRWHYQWIVLNDFLPRIVHSSVINSLKSHGQWDPSQLRIYTDTRHPFMPVEFSVAAYRLGHSMIRPSYRLNDSTRLPIFPIPGAVDESGAPLNTGLTGFRALNPAWGLDWGRFIDIDQRGFGSDAPDAELSAELKAANLRRLQFAYRIDTSLVDPLSTLPVEVAANPASLAERNLLRGVDFGLPSGQAVAKHLKTLNVPDFQPIDPQDIRFGKATGKASDLSGLQDKLNDAARKVGASTQDVNFAIASFSQATPLWAYILAEAAANQEPVILPVTDPGKPASAVMTQRLGPVGGRIVAETFLALMFGDSESYLNATTPFTPMGGNEFGLREFVAYASGPL
jgi:hypothetical protein